MQFSYFLSFLFIFYKTNKLKKKQRTQNGYNVKNEINILLIKIKLKLNSELPLIYSYFVKGTWVLVIITIVVKLNVFIFYCIFKLIIILYKLIDYIKNVMTLSLSLYLLYLKLLA